MNRLLSKICRKSEDQEQWKSLSLRCIRHLRMSELKFCLLPPEQENNHKLNVLLTVHRDLSLQQKPTRGTIYFQFISLINLYMFRAGLLLIIRRYYSVYTANCICHKFLPTANQHKRMAYTNCCINRVAPPDDEQENCAKLLEINY